MRDADVLANWIGTDADRLFLKVPAAEVPRLMEWILYALGCTHTELVDEIANVLAGMKTSRIDYGEFRNAVLYHEARKRHREIGHGDDCIADTAYTKAVKRINNSDAPESPCECGGVPLPGDWEELRGMFIAADWVVTVKTLSDGAWMDIQRPGDHSIVHRHMALFRPYSGEQSRALIYDPTRDLWFVISERSMLALAWQQTRFYMGAATGQPETVAVTPPPYLHALPERRKKTVNFASRRDGPIIDSLPVEMSLLTKAERGSVKNLTGVSDAAFIDAVMSWASRAEADPRIFLCRDLIERTCAALGHLPRFYSTLPSFRQPTQTARNRHVKLLAMALQALGLSEPPPWQPEPKPLPEPVFRESPPQEDFSPPPEPEASPSSGMRLEAARVLASLYPDEFADLRENLSDKNALLKLKERHYADFNEIRRHLQDGQSAADVLADLTTAQLPDPVPAPRLARRSRVASSPKTQ